MQNWNTKMHAAIWIWYNKYCGAKKTRKKTTSEGKKGFPSFWLSKKHRFLPSLRTSWDKFRKSGMCQENSQHGCQNKTQRCCWGLLGLRGLKRDVPWWLPARSWWEALCKAAGVEARAVPWEALVRDTLAANSIFPSSLTRRSRISSSSTAIVLFRSAACRRIDH